MSTVIQPGSVIEGKYRVVRHIGEGGMGTVYEGLNDRIDRRVAIKVLHPEVAASPEFAQRFEREARAAARIGSPHICDVLDSGELPSGDRYIVMEFLDGESLEDRIARGPMGALDLAPIAFEVLEGLRTMHQAGVIHRDLKPANVFLVRRSGRGRGEIVKILDFGVAKLLPRAGEDANMTSTGVMIGTPLYMSPEQARGSREVDARTDIYAASVMFYRALTGKMPHAAANLHELLFKIVLEEPASIRVLAPDVDSEFSDIVMYGLARDVDQRLGSARAYQEAIAAWGQRHGHPSVRFEVGESFPPANLSGTGPRSPNTPRMSAAAQPVPSTGPAPLTPGAAPPAIARTQVHDPSSPSSGGVGALTDPATPSARNIQSGGTPIVWSEDAPRAVQEAMRALESKHGSVPNQRTFTAAMAPVQSPAAASTNPPTPTLTHAPVPPQSKPAALLVAIVGAGAILAAGAFVVSKFVNTSASPAASTSVATAPPPPEPTPTPTDIRPPPTPSATTRDVPPPASATTDPTTAPPPSVATSDPPPRPTVPGHTFTPPRPPPAPSVVASVAKSATPPPAPTPTSSARKFRTTLD